MRNERGGSRKTGRTDKPGYKGAKSTSSSSDKRKSTGNRKFSKPATEGGYKKSTGPKKYGDKKWDDNKDDSSSSKPGFKKKFAGDKKPFDREKKPYGKKSTDDKFSRDKKPFGSKPPFKKKPGDE